MVPAETTVSPLRTSSPRKRICWGRSTLSLSRIASSRCFGLLDRDHRVAAGWNGGAGHDPDGAARLDRGSYGSSGRDIAGDPQGAPRPAVGRSHRKAVHGRIVVERHVPRGHHVFGNDPAESRQELNPLHTERGDAGENHASRDFKGGHNRTSFTLNRGVFQTAATAEPAGARIPLIKIGGQSICDTDDPKKKDDVTFIPRISAAELLEKDLDDLIIERPCLEILQNSEVIDKIQIINGLEGGKFNQSPEWRAGRDDYL